MSRSQLQNLIHMANQITANMGHLDDAAAASQVASHITRFWARSMRQQLQDYAAADGADLAPRARLAVAELERRQQ